MAGLAGKDGAVSYAAATVAELTGWTIDGANVQIIEDTVMGDENRTYVPGRKDSGTLNATIQMLMSDTAQDGWVNDVIDGNAATEVAVIATMDTGKTFTFQAIASTFSVTADAEGIVTAQLSAKITGPITEAWA